MGTPLSAPKLAVYERILSLGPQRDQRPAERSADKGAMKRALLALALLLASPATGDDCDDAERAERSRARCVVTLIRAGLDAARAEAECAVAHPVPRCDDDD